MHWDEDAVMTLRRMLADGATDEQIGRAVGVSVNAVIGKRYRLELFRAGRNPQDPYVMAVRRAERERARAPP